MALTKVGKEGITGISNSSDATAITIDSSETVGIGLSSPLTNYKIHVDANSDSDGRVARFSQAGTDNAIVDVTAQNGTNTEAFSRYRNDANFFSVGIDGNDNFSIGKSFANTIGNTRVTVLSGGGLTFNGDTAAANALNDYETGTWTPAFDNTVGNGPTVTYTYQIGRYTKVGNRVHWTARISWSAFSMNGSGYALLAGFPFTSDGTTAFSQGSNTFGYANGIGGSDGLSGLYIDAGANKFYMTTSANPTAELLGSNIASSGTFYCGGSVQV